MTDLDAGLPAPDFELKRDGGDTVRLSDFRGKIVVLFFYPKDDTTGCTAEAIDFTRNLARFEDAGAVVLGISPDSVERHRRFKAKHALGMPLLSDEQHEVLASYGVWSEKSMFGRSYMGVVRTTFLVDRAGLITRVWRKVRVAGHAADVLAEVQAMDQEGTFASPRH